MSAKQAKQSKLGQSLFTIFFMLAVTVVFISALSLIHVLTRERIQLNEGLVLKTAVLYAAGLAVPTDALEADRLYDRRVREVRDPQGVLRFYEILSPDGEAASYVVPVLGAGLWGEIESVVGIELDLGTLTGIEFVKQNETPGLGARITESWFKEQFRGKRFPLSVVPEREEAGGQEFQAITGATNTVNAVQDILNVRLAEAERVIRER